MRAVVCLVVLAACGGRAPASTPPTTTPPAGAPYVGWCTLTPTYRADGLAELRGRPGELVPDIPGTPCPPSSADPWLAILRVTGKMLVGPHGLTLGPDWVRAPIATHEDGGVLVVELMSDTSDRRCTDDRVSAGTLVHTDQPDQTARKWIPLDATDEAIRLEYHYAAGGCASRVDGDTTVIELPDPATSAVDELVASADAWEEEDVRFEVIDDVLLVHVPWESDVGHCRGTAPPPGESYSSSGPSANPGFIARRVVIPATAARVVVRPHDLGPAPPCA